MAYRRHVKTSFEMSNGRTLICEYSYIYYPATWDDPADSDVGEPTYYIDDEEVEYKDLPKGLDVIADKLYEASYGEFNYKESDDEPDYYED